MDLPTGKRLVALRERVVRLFKKGDWEAICLLTGQSGAIDGHERLLRSLYFNDDDYPGNALTVLRAIVEADPPALTVIEEYVNEQYPNSVPETKTTPAAVDVAQPGTSINASSDTLDYDIALSFAGEDRDYVKKVADQLRVAGVKVFYDEFEAATLWGKNLVDHLADVYGKRSKFVIIFASKHYAQKAWPTYERQAAQARAMEEQQVVVLPARFDDTQVPGIPSTVGYIDLVATSVTDFVSLVLAKLGRA